MLTSVHAPYTTAKTLHACYTPPKKWDGTAALLLCAVLLVSHTLLSCSNYSCTVALHQEYIKPLYQQCVMTHLAADRQAAAAAVPAAMGTQMAPVSAAQVRIDRDHRACHMGSAIVLEVVNETAHQRMRYQCLTQH
eukprot:17938-Heterococcus_DN1.PRE.3